MNLIFTKRAQSELEEIYIYISKDSPDAARNHVQKLINRSKTIIHFPQSGRIVPEYPQDNLREIIEGNYRIVYKIDEKKKCITIITIFESHYLMRKMK